MSKGLFITVEGPDGAGKSTQIERIKAFFDELGLKTLFTREPGGTKISEKLREIILDNGNSEMAPGTEALLYAASRAQLVEEVIKPALMDGTNVICDRYIDSSIAYQGFGRELGADRIMAVNEFAAGGLMPDLTILLLLDPESGRKRLDETSLDRLESEKLDFHKKVYEGYQYLAEKYPERVKAIDAKEDIDVISEEIAGILREKLG